MHAIHPVDCVVQALWGEAGLRESDPEEGSLEEGS
jgi:hypothetical protein